MVTFCTGRCRSLPPHGRRSARAGPGLQALLRDRGELAAGAPRAEAVPHRPGARDARTRARGTPPRGVPAGAAQDPGVQLAAGTPSSPPGPASLLLFSRRPGGPHLSAPVVVALAKRERSVDPATTASSKAGPAPTGRPRIAVLSPYFPYPLSHGGAVRIFHLLREIAREFDVELFAFSTASRSGPAAGILRAHRAGGEDALPRAALVHAASARGPRVPLHRPCAARSPKSAASSASTCCRSSIRTWPNTAATSWWSTTSRSISSARSSRRERTLSARVGLLPLAPLRTHRVPRSARRHHVGERRRNAGHRRSDPRIENGVDLDRFQPEPETPGQRLLFIGSFRHFPNIAAYRFFTERSVAAAARQLPGA